MDVNGNRNNESLIVLGNGFDLHCQLKSSFSDFISSLFKKNDGTWDNELIRSNYWYLLFYYSYFSDYDNGVVKSIKKGEIHWMDIEDLIKEVLNNSRNNNITPLEIVDNVFITPGQTRYPKGEINNGLKGQQFELSYCAETIYYKYGYNNSFDLLLDELKRFEMSFAQYLDNQIKAMARNNIYQGHAFDLLSKIRNYCNSDSIYIINFNYTNPFDYFKFITPVIPNNIHGSLKDDDIIIGVDSKELVTNDERTFRFTKAWRKISARMNSNKIPKYGIKYLVFFGHSLGSQDYSYFYSLFNYYDIYDSDTTIVFLYSNYHFDKSENLKWKSVYIDKVFALLREYVTASLNANEANSFITKIQLEGRLIVKSIENL